MSEMMLLEPLGEGDRGERRRLARNGEHPLGRVRRALRGANRGANTSGYFSRHFPDGLASEPCLWVNGMPQMGYGFERSLLLEHVFEASA